MGLAGLVLATLAFVGSHLALSHPLRLRLIGAVGETRFTLLYSVVALAALVWMVVAWRGIDDELPLWIAPEWAFHLGLAVMLVASILLVGSFVRNPAFPHPGAQQKTRPATGVFALTRHPMNWAFILWALVHLSLWAEPRDLVVAGGILILAVAGSIGQDVKKRAAMGEPWRKWESRTSFMPFGAVLAGRARWRDLWPGWGPFVGGFLFWILFVTWHVPAESPIVWLGQSLL
jgi:uncharacterized membrane protein